MNKNQGSTSIVVASAIMGSATALLAVAAAYLYFYQNDFLSGQMTVPQQQSAPKKIRESTIEEEIQQVIAWRTEQLAKFNAESIDPEWSENTQNILLGQFDDINQERGLYELEPFIVDNLECRTSMCVATLRWDNIEIARDASPTIAGYNYHLICATSSLVYDDPQQADNENYRSEVIFRCKRK